jgi:predicted ribosomally synthesized peptide with nif11-like leader
MKTIKEFVNQLRTEKSFAQKYANFDEDEFIAEAKKDGYEFSKEEFNDIADGKVSISLEDLENVTGGLKNGAKTSLMNLIAFRTWVKVSKKI